LDIEANTTETSHASLVEALYAEIDVGIS
jgi:hypothetical protein